MAKKNKKGVCEEHVFANIYENYSKDLYAYLYFKFGSQITINDKIQDAFMQLWINCKKVMPTKARAYLFRVGKNLVLNDIKHQKIVLKYQQIPQKSYTNETPEFLLEEEQFMQKYQLALGKLTEDQRVAFLLNKVKGKRPTEIAEMLGVTRRVIENRIFVAFKKLKKEIKELNSK
jgi:RNA polymerase sigma-70 factor (ECF subfamily)